MNRWIRTGLGAVGTVALAVAPLTAVASDKGYDDDKGYEHKTPKPYVQIVDAYAKTVDVKVITKYVNYYGKVVKVKVDHYSKSEAAAKVAYKCFIKYGSHPEYGKIKAILDDWYGETKAHCNGYHQEAYVKLYGYGRLDPGYKHLKVVIKDPQGKEDHDKEKVKVHHEKVVKVIVKKVHY